MLLADGRPHGLTWNYSRAEIIADGVVHAVGIALGLAGAVVLMALTLSSAAAGQVASVLIYTLGLLAVLGFSAAYNLWPISPWKWLLRRFDHSAIYLLIGGTYTPFLLHLKASVLSVGLLAGVWVTAAAGIALKLLLPGRFDRLSVAICLALGWSGVLVYDAVIAALSPTALILLAAGGAFYSIGIVFHAWQSLRFQNAVWHAFVLLAACCHYFAILDTVALAAE